jgi:hypothetical protein
LLQPQLRTRDGHAATIEHAPDDVRVARQRERLRARRAACNLEGEPARARLERHALDLHPHRARADALDRRAAGRVRDARLERLRRLALGEREEAHRHALRRRAVPPGERHIERAVRVRRPRGRGECVGIHRHTRGRGELARRRRRPVTELERRRSRCELHPRLALLPAHEPPADETDHGHQRDERELLPHEHTSDRDRRRNDARARRARRTQHLGVELPLNQGRIGRIRVQP